MDEIIQIVVFVAIMVIGVVQQTAKEKKKPKKVPSPQEVLEEMFPEILQEKPTAEAQPVIETPVVKKRKTFTSQKQTEKLQAVSPPQVEPSSDIHKKICLNTRKEARRAFIYSEIFNRKY